VSRVVLLLAPIVIVACLVRLNGQTQQAPDHKPPSFEVASIKPSDSLDSGGSAGFQAGGRFRAVNIAPLGFIVMAYASQDHPLFRSQIIGAPDWIGSTRYNVTAKVSDDLAAQNPSTLGRQMPLFLRALLQERFNLQVHHETRELPVFALRLLRKDGRLGPQMRPSTATCPGDRDKCSLHFSAGGVSSGAMLMSALVGILASNTERVVIDDTGLQGAFDVTLEWSLTQDSTDKPSIFGAVEEELGLKLEPTRAAVDVLVIDHVEKPTPD